MDKKYSAQNIAQINADTIMRETKNTSTKPFVYRNKKHGENSPVFCLLCGTSVNFITSSHFEKHGFKSRREMIDSGMVKFTDFFDGR